ncbi:MAG TPA: AzlD domain-containing protein [Alphaproteobacteria bacterium]|nr:AzlD domain-containing protein [Alphaproteobacteria bacterium]
MPSESETLLAIFGMAAVTYFTRAGGLWLARRIAPSERLSAVLGYIPGAVIISIVAPNVLGRSPSEAIAAGVTVLASILSGSLPLAMVAGVATVWLGRHLGAF